MSDFATSVVGVIGYLVGLLTWLDALAIFAVVYLVFLLKRLHSDQSSPYDIRDILLNHQTNKADADAHILVFMALLSAWAVLVKLGAPWLAPLTACLLVWP